MAEAPDPTDEEISTNLQAAITRYLDEGHDKEPLKIITIGKGGIGKSTLVNNILRLDGDDGTQADWSATSVTKGVKLFTCILNGVPIHVYDTPGLEDDGIDLGDVMKEINEQTKGSINVVLYVSSLNNRLNNSDKCIITAFTKVFSPKIWKHTILVLSNADSKYNEKNYVKITSDTAATFQKFLREQSDCEKMTVHCIHTQDDIEGTYDIPAIPTGKFRDGDPADWYSLLLILALRTCNEKGIIPLLIATAGTVLGGGVAGVAGVVGHAIGGAAVATLGATTTTIYMCQSAAYATLLGITSASYIPLGVSASSPVLLTAPATITFGASTATVATGAAIGAATGVAGGVIIAVAGGYAFKRYVWPSLRSLIYDTKK